MNGFRRLNSGASVIVNKTMTIRLLFTLVLCLVSLPSRADELASWALLQEQGAIVLFRHANAPGIGDPDGFKLGDCSTQRNLDDRGRAEARAIGEAFRQRGISVGRVLSSQWCRARDTANLAFPGRAEESPAFNSFFGSREAESSATASALGVLGGWSGPGAMVVVTHQVNIASLTGLSPRPGEGVVISLKDGRIQVLGRLPPPELR